MSDGIAIISSGRETLLRIDENACTRKKFCLNSTPTDVMLTFANALSVTTSRNRFQELKWFLVEARTIALPVWYFSLALSIDESMVPYYGRRSLKIFLRGKPIHMGYKVWMLCGRDGYPCHLSIHQGKESACERAPHSESVVTKIVDDGHCQSLMRKTSRNVFSYDTLKKSSDLNVRATGAVRLNRTGKLMNLRRNSYDCSCDGKVYIVRWHDNAVVTVASNWQTHGQLHTVNQQVAFQRKDVKQPRLIQAYNSGMGDIYCCSTNCWLSTVPP
ncbi:PiggyBac transposable element-derived protein 3 [Trichinella nelsoni]|uniref:PiggyBac transposable element-derived protein 3 n=1 Tax=Trichinella nelsoni TaxID=6336 RepID=A0A0V0RWC0_9BILA|nr:PiggyBac transposable element-derived protein 3 [Trichinella nelsoni]